MFNDFYRSINYFYVEGYDLFEKPECLNRIKFIMTENLKLIYNNDYEKKVDNENIQQISAVTKKVVKQLDRAFR